VKHTSYESVMAQEVKLTSNYVSQSCGSISWRRRVDLGLARMAATRVTDEEGIFLVMESSCYGKIVHNRN
jgi:hypothetical protein